MIKIILLLCFSLFFISCKNEKKAGEHKKTSVEKKLSVERKANLFAATFEDSCTISYFPSERNKKGISFNIYPKPVKRGGINDIMPCRFQTVRNCVINDSASLFSTIRFKYLGADTVMKFDWSLPDTTLAPPEPIDVKTRWFFQCHSKRQKTYFTNDNTTGKKDIIFSIKDDKEDNKQTIDNYARFLKACVLDSVIYSNMNFYYSNQGKEVNYPLTDTLFTNIR